MRTHIDPDMATDPLAADGIFGGRNARPTRGASLIRARNGVVAGLKLTGPRGFAKAKANGGGTTTNRKPIEMKISRKII